MLNLVLFILACYGMTNILVYGKIFAAIRKKIGGQMVQCPMCVGFWVGLWMFLWWYAMGVELFYHPAAGSFIFGCVSSGTSYILTMLVGDEGFNLKKN